MSSPTCVQVLHGKPGVEMYIHIVCRCIQTPHSSCQALVAALV